MRPMGRDANAALSEFQNPRVARMARSYRLIFHALASMLGVMNLLDQFILQHVQVSLLEAKLLTTAKGEGAREAKVELKLAPRLIKTDSGDKLPAYQISARLICKGESIDDQTPRFRAQVGIEAVYQQIDGEPLDLAEFGNHHGSLTRQLYPLMQQELRLQLMRIGLEQVHLPFDLPAKVEFQEDQTVQVSGAVH